MHTKGHLRDVLVEWVYAALDTSPVRQLKKELETE